MRKLIFLFLLFHFSNLTHAQDKFQLASPLVKYKSAYIRDSVIVEVLFNQPGAAVHYTLELRDPTEKDPVYRTPLSVKKPGTIRFKAIGNDFEPSETISVSFFPAGKKIDSIRTSAPQEFYKNQSAETLNDAVGGIANFRSGHWTGFNSDSVWIECSWNRLQTIIEIDLGLLQDEASWIFLPKRIEYWKKDRKTGKWLINHSKDIASTAKGPKQVYIDQTNFNPEIVTSAIKILMINHSNIPDWHESKGERAWIFIDEVMVRSWNYFKTQ